jgi:hypothetical protein
MSAESLAAWLAAEAANYRLEPIAVLRRGATAHWPFVAANEAELLERLTDGGHLLPLPDEPSALANILEVSIVDFLLKRLEVLPQVSVQRGTQRSYPAIDVSGGVFGEGTHAVDVKVARRNATSRATQSRITLYTGNTYFRYPQLKWPGMSRPFVEYASHFHVIALYTLNEESVSRATNVELIVSEPWRIASTHRSSTTREYIGAVKDIDLLRNGGGDFSSIDAFYSYWRAFPFTIGRSVQTQLDRLLTSKVLP